MSYIRESKGGHSTARKLAKKIFLDSDLPDWMDGHRVWVLWKEGEPVGFCSYKVNTFNECYFSLAGVLPNHEGNGYHTKMIRHRLKKAKGEGADVALTHTLKDKALSFNNLQKCGFKLYVPENKYRGNDALYWRKELI